MEYKSFTVGELRSLIRESAKNEFKPVLGKNVERDNKANNDKVYKQGTKAEEAKESHDYEPSLQDSEQRGMSDLIINNADKGYKDRMKAQMKGHTSVENEKTSKSEEYGNDKYGNASYGDDKMIGAYRDHAKRYTDGRVKGKTIGLTSRELPKKDFEELNKPVIESSTIKKFVFKKTKFLSEAHMLTRVPDIVKEDGTRFVMRDCDGYEYLVEWHSGKPLVDKRLNENDVKNEFARLNELFNFKSERKNITENITDGQFRLQEENKVGDMMSKVRELMKK